MNPAAPLGAAEILAAARAVSPDPFPDDVPAAGERDVDWYYLPGELDLARLHRLVVEGEAANRHVDYAPTYRALAPAATVRLAAGAPVRLHVPAPCRIESLDGARRAPATTPGEAVVLTGASDAVVRLVCDDPHAPVAIGVERVGEGARVAVRFADGAVDPSGDAGPALAVPGTRVAPHQEHEPVHVLELAPGGPVPGGERWDAPGPALGHVVVHADRRPVLVPGESVPEALAEPGLGETRTDVVERTRGVWVSVHRLAVRHVVVRDASATRVAVEATVRPVPHRGAFVCDNPVLDVVWASSAYTLRLCLQQLLVDGVKRDRMPWIGDIGVALPALVHAFGDVEILRSSVRALSPRPDAHVNGITDYSLWWLVSHGLYRTLVGEDAFIAEETAAVADLVASLDAETDDSGLLRPRERTGTFPGAGPGGVFIDWGFPVPADPGDAGALQLLWYWALRSAAQVLAASAPLEARRWEERAQQVLRTIGATLTDATGVLLSGPGGAPDPYATLLAVHSGAAQELAGAVPEAAAALVGEGRFGTPFMRTLGLVAVGRAGERAAAVERIAREWGAMLETGSTTFWEELPGAGSPWAMYGRPFGRSLCHGWASGPAAALPELVLGLRPLAPGWREVAVDPELGSLGWAAAVVPTSLGSIAVTADRAQIVLELPAGVTAVVDGERVAGPGRHVRAADTVREPIQP